MARRFIGKGTGHGLNWDDKPIYTEYQNAEQTVVDTTNFDKFLDSSHNTVQKALERVNNVHCAIDGGRSDEVFAVACNIDGGGA